MQQTNPQTGAKGSAAGQAEGNQGKQSYSPPKLPRLELPRSSRTHYTTWLLIRYAAGDHGVRALAPGTRFWESPDVWVESSLGINQPVVGQPNTVFALVTNLGWQYATGVTVKFYWADPALAITETSAHLIGKGFAQGIPSGWSVPVVCPNPWVPVVENGGHECLIAEAFIPKFDPLTAPMDPVEDRHVGQRNEQLIQLAAGHSFATKVRAVNATAVPLPVTIEVRPVILAAIHPLMARRTRALQGTMKPPSSVLPLSVRTSDESSVYTGPSTLLASRMLSMAKQESAGTGFETMAPVQVTQTTQFQPWESREIKITGQVPSGAQVGQTYGFQIVQRIGGMVAGGYTVNVVVVNR